MSACVNGEEELLGEIDERVDSILIPLPSCLAWEMEHMQPRSHPKRLPNLTPMLAFSHALALIGLIGYTG